MFYLKKINQKGEQDQAGPVLFRHLPLQERPAHGGRGVRVEGDNQAVLPLQHNHQQVPRGGGAGGGEVRAVPGQLQGRGVRHRGVHRERRDAGGHREGL